MSVFLFFADGKLHSKIECDLATFIRRIGFWEEIISNKNLLIYANYRGVGNPWLCLDALNDSTVIPYCGEVPKKYKLLVTLHT